MSKPYKDLSKGITINEPYKLTRPMVATAALLRIADATEMMATNYVKLQNDLDYYKKEYFEHQKMIEKRDNTIRTLRGHITRLKNKK